MNTLGQSWNEANLSQTAFHLWWSLRTFLDEAQKNPYDTVIRSTRYSIHFRKKNMKAIMKRMQL